MSDNKKNLQKLLQFIDEISRKEGNEWFKETLQNRFSKTDPSINFASLESKVNLIKEYLFIDIKNVIDYSEFTEPTRESLFRDCIEMGRYEKGTPNHKIDFGEFCRYAHLQAEEMVNYFFIKKTNNKINQIEDIVKKESNYNPTKKPTEVHHIPYTYKLIAFRSISGIPYKIYEVLWFLNDIRNELSHRNSLSKDKEDRDLALFEKSGFVNSKIDFLKLDKKQREIYNNGKYVIEKRNENFNLIFESIEGLKKQILDSLQSKKGASAPKPTIGDSNPVLQELKEKLLKQNE